VFKGRNRWFSIGSSISKSYERHLLHGLSLPLAVFALRLRYKASCESSFFQRTAVQAGDLINFWKRWKAELTQVFSRFKAGWLYYTFRRQSPSVTHLSTIVNHLIATGPEIEPSTSWAYYLVRQWLDSSAGYTVTSSRHVLHYHLYIIFRNRNQWQANIRIISSW